MAPTLLTLPDEVFLGICEAILGGSDSFKKPVCLDFLSPGRYAAVGINDIPGFYVCRKFNETILRILYSRQIYCIGIKAAEMRGDENTREWKQNEFLLNHGHGIRNIEIHIMASATFVLFDGRNDVRTVAERESVGGYPTYRELSRMEVANECRSQLLKVVKRLREGRTPNITGLKVQMDDFGVDWEEQPESDTIAAKNNFVARILGPLKQLNEKVNAVGALVKSYERYFGGEARSISGLVGSWLKENFADKEYIRPNYWENSGGLR